MVAIAPSILAADFSKLGAEVQQCELGGADRIHVDVMDGHFVPNLSMGAVVVRSLKPITQLPLEVHLMVEEPRKFVEGFCQAGADTLIFHLEVEPDPVELIAHIRSLGKKVGLAFNPDLNLHLLEPYLNDIDLALCMTVFPGFGGQRYIPECTERIRLLHRWIQQINPACELEVDGGIDRRTIQTTAEAGATVFVAGTSIFRSVDGPRHATEELKEIARAASGTLHA